MTRLRDLVLALLLTVSCAGGAWAMASGKSGSAANPEFDAGVQAVADGKWDLAVMKMTAVVQSEAKNADAHNYLGYAYRKLGNLDKAFEHYTIALQINPEHRGAQVYTAEADMMAGPTSSMP